MTNRKVVRAALVAVLAVMLASVSAFAQTPSMLARVRQLAKLAECSLDTECDGDDNVCLKNGKCGAKDDRKACGRKACTPEDEKRCTKNSDCLNSKCMANPLLGYKSCACPNNLEWKTEASEMSKCKKNGNLKAISLSAFECGCPDSMVLDNGWCVEACCEGNMKPRDPNGMCTLLCNSDSEDCIQDAADTGIQVAVASSSDYVCGCPNNKPYFDEATGKCVKENKCTETEDETEDLEGDDECPSDQELSGDCQKTCANPNPEVCTRENKCVCAEGKVFLTDALKTCVEPDECPDTETDDQSIDEGDDEDCPSGQTYSGGCQKTCADPSTEMCIKILKCVCPEGQVFLTDAFETCVDLEECPDDEEEEGNCPTGQSYLGGCKKTCADQDPENCSQEVKCLCDDGKIFLSDSDETCVEPEECPDDEEVSDQSSGDEEEDCPSYMELVDNACPATCDNPEPFCALRDVKRCTCTSGRYHDEANGRCVDVCCPSNKVFRTNGNSCVDTCQPEYQQTCLEEVTDGCFCPENMLWDVSTETCVETCPERDDLRRL
ncbi:Mucin-2 [Hondaea fermentalgiana]|uniref:Mucin-2 n=1 Tax=Hondaea fermentalgiana TaxID=2315210 RepID=A0A2R5GER9_9STRA|nr:Mucin-2 [Hondaea fermentalgiana]|eukprot:GBG28248.1 Mucin-2 [Hondaea fermentalgiana]